MKTDLLLLTKHDFSALSPSEQRQLYETFYHLVYGYIFYLLNDHLEAEDIIQESFLKTILKAPMVKEESQLIAWIRTVTRNLAFDYLRKNRHHRHVPDLESILPLEHLSTSAEQVEQEVETEQLKQLILDHLANANPDHRTLIELRWKYGLSYKQMASAMETSENKVKQRLHRARQNIRKKLKNDWG
ncbi:RNA polymerase sigma factor [Marinicrinis lubricantis]|uniref:RNA polymerase sigma factor n=1 Tax=Marinicrinis lubricantis TaxID=2086470 RepID=A0ABW1ILC7_9BACL